MIRKFIVQRAHHAADRLQRIGRRTGMNALIHHGLKCEEMIHIWFDAFVQGYTCDMTGMTPVDLSHRISSLKGICLGCALYSCVGLCVCV